MNSQWNTPIQDQVSSRGRQGAYVNTASHVHPRVTSGPFIDSGNYQDDPAQRNNAFAQSSSQYYNKCSMDEFLMTQEARMNEFLRYSGNQVEEQRSALRQVVEHLSRTATNFGHSIAQWIGHPSADQAANFHRELEKSHARYVKVDNLYRQLKLDHQALQKQLQESTSELKSALEERDEQRRLAETANWMGSLKVSDDAIQSKWKQLEYNIRSMARALAKCNLRRVTNTATKDRFANIGTRSNRLLEDDDYKEFILSAYLWVCVEEILQDGGEIWGGDYGASFKEIRGEFIECTPEADKPSRQGPSLRHVARWSAQGAAFFMHFFGRDEQAFRRRAHMEIEILESFCNLPTDNSSIDFLQEMKGIIEVALELDEMLMNSKAIFTVERPAHDNPKSLRFEADKMEAVAHSKELSSKTAIHFFISPMLVKMGNADGCNYHSRKILCKALTVCR